MIRFRFVILFVLFIQFSVAKGQEIDTLLQILKEELTFEMNELKNKEYPPYYMDFRVADHHFVAISTLNGSIISSSEDHKRMINPTIRIGNYTFDNTHELENTFGAFPSGYLSSNDPYLPIDNNPEVIKFKIWENTNELYKNCIDEYKLKLEAAKKADDSSISDFTIEETENYYEEPFNAELYSLDIKYWENKLSYLDSVFATADNYYWGGSNFLFLQKAQK